MSCRAETAGAKRWPLESRHPLQSTDAESRRAAPRVPWARRGLDHGDQRQRQGQPSGAATAVSHSGSATPVVRPSQLPDRHRRQGLGHDHRHDHQWQRQRTVASWLAMRIPGPSRLQHRHPGDRDRARTLTRSRVRPRTRPPLRSGGVGTNTAPVTVVCSVTDSSGRAAPRSPLHHCKHRETAGNEPDSRGAFRTWHPSRNGDIAPHRDVPGTECAGTTSQ
jgi:hypothetical protein